MRRNGGTLFIRFLIAILALSSAGANATSPPLSHYPDFAVSTIADNHISLRYQPQFGEDFITVARATKHIVDGREIWGRSFNVAVPADGDAEITFTYSRVGATTTFEANAFASESTPLVVKQSPFWVRGHKLVQFIILPQRQESGRLVAYSDFAVDIHISGTISETARKESSRLDIIASQTVINPEQYFAFGEKAENRGAFKPQSNAFDATSQWLKIVVRSDGVYRITAAELQQAGISISTLRSDSLRMFYAGGVIAPPNFSDPQPDLYQIPVRINDGGDGIFSGSDNLYFYGEAISRFDFDNNTISYIQNHYTFDNVYWLAVGGQVSAPLLRWQTEMSQSGTPDEILTAVAQPLRVEQNNLLKIDGDGHTRNFFTWFWSDQTSLTASFVLPGLVSTGTVDIEFGALCDFTSTTLALNGEAMTKTTGSGSSYHYITPAASAVAGLNTLQISLRAGVSGTYADYLNVLYPMALSYGGEQFEFNSFGHEGLIQFTIAGYTSDLTVLDISDPDDPRAVTNITAGSFARPISGAIGRYVVYSTTNTLTPVSIDRQAGEDLSADVAQYDCIAISPRRFQNALSEYASYRLQADGYRVKLAAIEDIYDDFGFGLESPLAIRSYLKFAYENFAAPAPFAVLLAGDGHYDFQDNLGMHLPSYVPPFIWDVEFSAGDDNFVYFGDVGWLDSDSSFVPGDNRGWDMMVGRWPVRSSSEVAAYIAKLKAYEAPESQGIWRSRITFVADDEYKNDYSGEIIHTAQAETLAVFHTPVKMFTEKIYATDYPFASNGDKPTVNSAIVNAINDGTLIINYIGHGSPDVWADEHIFEKSGDLGRLNNSDKPTTVIAGSCSIGLFDQPGSEGMAEMLFRMDGGAIATISATRLVYSRDNAIFSYDLYDAIFEGNNNLCEAVYAAKMLHQYEFPGFANLLRNDRSYVVFGDPLAETSLPAYQINLQVNGDSLLTPLEFFGFTGHVVDGGGNPITYDGKVQLDVYDSRFIRHHPLGIDYSLGGPHIYRGIANVAGGSFTSGFIVPLDIDYGGTAAQISGFSGFSSGSALGGLDSLMVAESAGITTDNSGPTIEFSIDGLEDFRTGDRIPQEAELVVDLSDVSGINLTGGLGHRIELTIDNDNTTTVNLTDRFSYDEGNYQSGQLRYVLPKLSNEMHSFKLKAWDNANNPAITEFEAMTSQSGHIALENVMNYPNPMEDFTEFYFELSESADWGEVKIFTLSGRMVKTLRTSDLVVGKNRRFHWDGRDLDGDRVAQGVYLYKITIKGRVIAGAASTDNKTEAFGKIVLLN